MTVTGSPFNDVRMARYREANSQFPDARKNELKIIDTLFPKDEIDSVLEIGSGTGFLTENLLERGLTVDTIDLHGRYIDGVRNHYQEDVKTGFSFIPDNVSYDLLISLAAFHHIVECPESFQAQLMNDIDRITGPNSYLLIVDVPSEDDQISSGGEVSEAAAIHTGEFFRSIVDRYSVPFHNGVYLKTVSLADQFENHGWQTLWRQNLYCPWRFGTMEELSTFLSLLFNIPEIKSISPYQDILQKMVIEKPDCVNLQWGLSAFLLRRT